MDPLCQIQGFLLNIVEGDRRDDDFKIDLSLSLVGLYIEDLT